MVVEQEFLEEEPHESIYTDETREGMVEDGRISPEEEGFMQGYDNEETVVCAFCRKPVIHKKEVLEKEINNKFFRFCSEGCLEELEEDLKTTS